MSQPAKRRKTEHKIEEINFDLSARQDYLTGFHKRKVQRTKLAQEKAAERARLEKIEARKKLRDERKLDLEKHVQAINDMLPSVGKHPDDQSAEQSDASDEGWEGIADQSPEPIDQHAEYIDEDKYTSVTVETMNVTRDGLVRADLDDSPAKGADAEEPEPPITERKKDMKSAKRPWAKDKPKDKANKPKKKRNFRYEGKLDRKANRVKQRRKNSEQAKARKAG